MDDGNDEVRNVCIPKNAKIPTKIFHKTPLTSKIYNAIQTITNPIPNAIIKLTPLLNINF